MLLLDFGQIRQYLTDVVDTVKIVITHRNIDIGLVMLFKLTSVIPAFPVSDITPVQTGLLRPGIRTRLRIMLWHSRPHRHRSQAITPAMR